jgi:hypothetical protein
MPSDHPSKWQEEDLLGLISNKVEESLVLEYKASPSLQNNDERKSDVGKDVSSFANSAGGAIVYGMTEGANGLPQALDGLDPSVTKKEWLGQVIHSRIQPRLDVHINPVSLTTQHPGKVAYVVSIPQGKTAHQASDGKYYKRYNSLSVPMQDHEIRDVMARASHPIVEPIFSFREKGSPESILYLRMGLKNIGAMRAREIKVVLAIPPGLFKATNPEFFQGSKQIDGHVCDSFAFQRTDLIIFPDDELAICGTLTSTGRYYRPIEVMLSTVWYVSWKIYADDMPPSEGRILFKDIPPS